MLHRFLGIVSAIVGGLLTLFSLWGIFVNIKMRTLYESLNFDQDPGLVGSVIVLLCLFIGIFLLISAVKIIRGNRSRLLAGLSMFFLFLTFILASAFIFLTTYVAAIMSQYPD